jgi:hypothetical protein
MNIIEMAKQAGFKDPTPADGYMGLAYDYNDGTDSGGDLTRFAALVRAATLKEAEMACDEVSLQANTAWKLAFQLQDQGREMGAEDCAAAIRQLKEAK